MKKYFKSLAFLLVFSLLFSCFTACKKDPGLIGIAESVSNGFLNTTATDDNGKNYGAVSGYDREKYVGIFYFLWNGSAQGPIQDVTNQYEKNHTVMDELLARQGDGGTPEMNSFHHWGESLYGHYCADDAWVIRKHIELFIHAGLDFIVFDTSNGSVYDSQVTTFLEILLEYERQGFQVPKLMFMTSVDPETSKISVRNIYDLFYDPAYYGEYDSLWFRGTRNKPWIIGTQPGDPTIDSYFYYKLPQWPNTALDFGKFPWIDWNYPQDTYVDSQIGNIVSVSVSQHVGLISKNGYYADFSDSGLFAPENRGELAAHGYQFEEKYIEAIYNANWGRGYDQVTKTNDRTRALKEATNFEQQWKTVHGLAADGNSENDIDMVFVTGWNEWVAQKQPNSSVLGEKYCHFVDTFNMEFSRDIEMSPEYLDLYYLSLVRNIRAYKGVGEGNTYRDSETALSGLMTSYEGWNSSAAYRDFSGETIARKALDASAAPIENETGRNDIAEIRVASDRDTIYFLIRTEEEITPHEAGDTRWMNLLLGVEGAESGWEGLQYAINREPGTGKTSLHRINGDSFDKIGECDYTLDGDTIRFAIKKEMIGIAGGDFAILFQAADNLQKDFDIAEYYVNGDVAPIGRIRYVYRVAA